MIELLRISNFYGWKFMKNINNIKNRIEKENVKFYDVGLPKDVLINEIDLFSIDNFIDFVQSQKINVYLEVNYLNMLKII